MRIPVYSKIFLDGDESWSARPTLKLMKALQGQESARLIAIIGETMIALGAPVGGVGDPPALYVPNWLLQGDGEKEDVEFRSSEDFARAEKISIKIVGDIGDIDIKELLEEPLSQLGVLKNGMMIPAPMLEGVILIVEVDPETAFLDGEVSLEVVKWEENTDVASPSPSPSPSAAAAATAATALVAAEDFGSMIPEQVLVPSQTRSRSQTAFQGKGRRLCD